MLADKNENRLIFVKLEIVNLVIDSDIIFRFIFLSKS